MNRRGFLKLIGVIGVAAVVPMSLFNNTKEPVEVCRCGDPITSSEAQLSVDDFHRRFLRPAMERLADQVEKDVLQGIYNKNCLSLI